MFEFLSGTSIWVYLIIFFVKVIEISLDTVRIVLINKGAKKEGALIGFVVIILWIFGASTVLASVKEDILKAFFYALGYSCGIYVGVIIEEKLAIGLASIEVNVRGVEGERLSVRLREEKFGVTVMKGEGFNHTRTIIKLHVSRKRINEAIAIIKDMVPDSVITINDISKIQGGYLYKSTRRAR